MKKILTLLSLTALIFSCAKKINPTTPPMTGKPVIIDKPMSPASVPATTSTPSTSTVAKDVPNDVSVQIAAGNSTYTAKCGRCHELKDPAHFSNPQWDNIMDRMAQKAHLDATEKSNVLAYVHANARK